ncbi:UDP-N-acetylmuramate dehydrogenase [Thalassotalea sp. PLHSN55]|uniref:UDP-N-acetylmuramate dehydrogenase n=1 Tax=Thalassotalea sp. PLHSN55 TaxID=3435888 RepID=UPI003F852E0E
MPLVSLKRHNSFAVNAYTPKIHQPSNIDELNQLVSLLDKPFYILGDGSNTLFADQQAPEIIKPNFTGIEIESLEQCYRIKVAASENWHQLVVSCVEQGIGGLENLALIPGSVGAAPVQNIGAYGVDIAMFCTEVSWYDFASQTLKTLTAEQCQFSYRDSIFKSSLKNKGLITHVTFELPTLWQPVLNYAGLDSLPATVTCKEVMAKVIEIRQQKLPDPKSLGNAGSFFKNPVVSAEKFKQLQLSFGDMPHYVQTNGEVKLAAGWLIDQAGLKGYRTGNVGVHAKQALVLVNYGSESGQDIVELAKFVCVKVAQKFNVELEPEVRLITRTGETAFKTLIA